MRKHLSEQHKQRLSESLSGRKVPWATGIQLRPEHRKKIGDALRGRKLSEETKRKMSEAHKGKRPSPETREKLSIWQRGRKRSDSFREKMSTIAKRRHYSQEYRDKMSVLKKGKFTGKMASGWKGGRYKDGAGYIRIYNPAHPLCNARGYVLEHRLSLEKALKRHLKSTEECHHLNNNKSDNRLENLMLFCSKGAHLSFEAGKSIPAEQIIFDGRRYHAISPSRGI